VWNPEAGLFQLGKGDGWRARTSADWSVTIALVGTMKSPNPEGFPSALGTIETADGWIETGLKRLQPFPRLSDEFQPAAVLDHAR